MELIDFGGFYNTQVQEKWNFVKTIFTTRFDHWRYEEEVRVFCDLNEKDPVSGHFFVDYSADLQLKEIIFGANFNGDAPCIRECVADGESIEFTTARLAFETFSVVTQKSKGKQF